MENLITEILEDLFALDNELRIYETQLRKAIEKLIQSKPDTKFDEAFKTRLRAELMEKVALLKKENQFSENQVVESLSASSPAILPKENLDIQDQKNKRNLFGAMFGSWHLNMTYAMLAALVVIVLSSLAFYGVNQYRQNGNNLANLFEQKGETKFEFQPTEKDMAGVDPNSSFIIKTSENLSEKKVKDLVSFEPKVEFTVTKQKSASLLVPTVYAEQEASELKYEYEIKATEPLKENVVYKVTVKDTSVADRQYQWAFQVRAPFGITETTPANKATFVPKNIFIEVLFNRELPDKIEDYFDISPKVEGTFEVKNDKLYFHPKQELQPQTVYTVTLKKGLTSKSNGESLLEDYKFSFETVEKDSDNDEPFSVDQSMIETTPDKNPAIKLSGADDTYKVDVYKFSSEQEYFDSVRKSRNWDYYWTAFAKMKNLDQYKPSDDKKILSSDIKPISLEFTSLLEIPQNLSDGYYFFTVSKDNYQQGGWILSSRVSHYYSLTAGKSMIWLHDFVQKQALQNAQVNLVLADNSRVFLGKTDVEGVLNFDTPTPLQGTLDQPLFLEVQSNNLAPVAINLNGNEYGVSIENGDRYWDYLSTDKNKYQPKDTLHYWGVLKGRNVNLKDSTLTIGLYDQYPGNKLDENNQPLVFEKKMVTAFDTLEGALQLEGMEPNYYFLVVSNGNGDVLSTKDVAVETYTKPAYGIKVEASQQAVFTGQSVDFTISANFYDGTSLTDGKLKYELSYGDDGKSEDLQLDKNGQAKISYTPEYKQNEEYNYPLSIWLNVVPAKSEEGEIWGSTMVEVYGPNINLQSSEKSLSNNEHQFTVKVNKIDPKDYVLDDFGYYLKEVIGEPVKNQKVNAKLIKTTYEKKEDGEYYDYITKTTQKKYTYDSKDEVQEEFSGATDDMGEWKFTKQLDINPEQTYKIEFTAADNTGKQTKDTAFVWQSESYYPRDGLTLSIDGGKTNIYGGSSFEVGDQVKLKAEVDGENMDIINGKVLYYRYQNDVDKAVVSGEKTYQETFEEKMAPNVKYKAVVLTNRGYVESNAVDASFEKQEKQLKIEAKSDKETYRPKDEVKMDINVKDKDGQAAQGQVNVSVVDEALFQNTDDWAGNILDGLYQSINYYPTISFTDYSYTFLNDGMGGCFAAGTPILLSDGTSKNIEDMQMGDEVLTYVDAKSKALGKAVVQGVTSHEVDEYLLINDSLKVTAEHRMNVNGEWQLAGKIKVGDELVGPDGAVRKVTSIKRIKALKTRVYNLLVGKYHTYFANGYFVHNEGKDGGRSTFLDVVSFQSVALNSDGEAEVSFKVPDNLTSWRVTARAFDSENMQAGQSVTNVPVSLPFFIDMTVNSTYLVGDNPQIRARIFGSAYQAGKPITYKIKSETLGIDKETTLNDQTVYIGLGQLPFGKHEITISAMQDNQSDTITRTINVVDGYARQTVAKVYDVNKDTKNIQGNSGGFTKLVFTDQGRGVYYETLEKNAFAQSLRSDQLAASYYSQQLLKEYFAESLADDSLDLDPYFQIIDSSQRSGLSLLPYSEANLEASAKLADLAEGQAYKEPLKKYFSDSMYDEKADIHRTCKALYGLASLGEPVLGKVQMVSQREEITMEDKIYLGLALVKSGDVEGARDYYEKEIHPKVVFDGPLASVNLEEKADDQTTDQIKQTATAGVLASYVGVEDARALWNFAAAKDPERDLDAMEEVMMAKSQLAQLGKDSRSEFTFETKARKQKIKLEGSGVYSLTLSSDELSSLSFDDVKGKVQVVSYYETPKAVNSANAPFSIERKYYVQDAPKTSFEEGQEVRVKLIPKFDESAPDGQYQIVDALPSGLKPITMSYGYDLYNSREMHFSGDDPCNRTWYADKISENVLYFNLSKQEIKANNCSEFSINYFARVSAKGEFKADSANLQSLERLEYYKYTPSEKIQIK